MSRTFGSRTRVISCEIHVCASVKSRSQWGFSRSRNSIGFLKNSLVDRRRNTVLQSAWFVGIGRISIGRQKKPEEMRSQLFGFLRILAIRVGFETNSMDPR